MNHEIHHTHTHTHTHVRAHTHTYIYIYIYILELAKYSQHHMLYGWSKISGLSHQSSNLVLGAILNVSRNSLLCERTYLWIFSTGIIRTFVEDKIISYFGGVFYEIEKTLLVCFTRIIK